jgi:hypothetical protein
MTSDTELPQQLGRRRQKLLALVTAALLISLVAGAGGYLLGMRNIQSSRTLQPPISSQAALITTNSYPAPTKFNPPPSWKVYKTVGYQYSYPPTWSQHPECKVPASGVSAPGVQYPEGDFVVKRLFAKDCDNFHAIQLQQNPSMHREQITISGYPAFQLEGKSKFGDGYVYDVKSVYVVHDNICYYLEVTSINNPERLEILNKILSTFELYK